LDSYGTARPWSWIQSSLAVSFRSPPERFRKGDREIVYFLYYSGVDTKDGVLRVYDDSNDYDYDYYEHGNH